MMKDQKLKQFSVATAEVLITISIAVTTMLFIFWSPSSMADQSLVEDVKNGNNKIKASSDDNGERRNGAPAVVEPHFVDDSTAISPSTTEHLVWKNKPIPVQLGIGPKYERMITLPAKMDIGIPSELQHLLKVQTVNNTTFLTAVGEFPKTRLFAAEPENGLILMLDVVASKSFESASPIEIHLPKIAPHDKLDHGDQEPLDYVTLTRFAAKQLYAPQRLVAELDGARRVGLKRKPILSLYQGGTVEATPLAQWKADDLYITAVKLRNISPSPIELNPLRINGDWLAITFQHGRLLPRGNESDTSAVYLICDRTFDACQ